MRDRLISWLTLCMALLTTAALAQDEALDETDALFAQGQAALEQFNAGVTTLRGEFAQRVYKPDGSVEESSGSYLLSRPGRFVWTYEMPYEQRIVADGRNLWLYDVDLDQVTVREQTEALGQSPAEILGGGEDVLAAFDYQGSFSRDGLLWVQLAARDPGSDFSALRLGFRDGVLAGMQLGDSLQQTTEILFDDVIVNAPVDDARFDFELPPGVDLIGTPSGQAAPAPAVIVPGLG